MCTPALSHRSVFQRRVLVFLLIPLWFFVAASTRAQGSPPVVDVGRADLAELVRAVPHGGEIRLEHLFLDHFGVVDLDLGRFRVFSEGAELWRGTSRAPVPRNVYLRGTVEGFPGSLAVLSFRERGTIGGWVQVAGEYWQVSGRAGVAGLGSARIDPSLAGDPFDCLTDALPGAMGVSVGSLDVEADSTASGNFESFSYTAQVAVETDWEFLELFGGDEVAAADYVGDVFAFASSIYEAEIDTSLYVSFLRFWPGNANGDPWSATDCTNQLYEFRDYWRANEGGQTRAIAHFLSGKVTGCGIAYVGVLCSSTYGYGVSASLRGNFDPGNPVPPVWDVLVVSHEIGHNFNSPHTHCYNGIPDASYPDPVDPCYTASGCYSGTPDLPAGCPGAGQGCGTIMSYCHLRSGGYGNITMTFGGSVLGGSSHLYGIFPQRVPERMHAYVLSKAGSGCLDPVVSGSTLSVTKAGTGTGVVTSDDEGIDCGADCSETYPEGSSPTVVLTATADEGSSFIVWSGDEDCEDGQVTVADNRACMAEFSSSCGNGVIDAGEVCDGDDLGGATCGTSGCTGGNLLCNATCDGFDYSQCTGCGCDSDGLCELGEDCVNCPSDCPSGEASSAVCGNGICEAGDGEDCVSCPADCNGVQRGKPDQRFCCGDGDGQGQIPPCDDPSSVCNAAPFQCSSTPGVTGSFCCGDLVCDGGEGCGNCALDCQELGETCGDGVDNDCNGQVDCADMACESDPYFCPSCREKNASCTADAECCSGVCEAKGNSGFKCR